MDIFKRYAQKNLRLAKEALMADKTSEANEFALKAVRLYPGLEEGWLILAATSNSQKCLFYLNKVLEINPLNEKAKNGINWVLSELGKGQEISDVAIQDKEKLQTSYDFFNTRIESLTTVDSTQKRNGGRLIQRMASRWQTYFSLACIFLILLVAIVAPLLSPLESPESLKYFKIACDRYRCVPEPPSQEFPLGTVKEFDVYHTLIWGTRQSLIFGLSTALVTALLGTFTGAIAAYNGGWQDKVIMRICDAFLAFPIIAAVALFAQLITLFTPTTLGLTDAQFNAIPQEFTFLQSLILNSDPILLALILFSWMPYARIIHAQVLQVKQTEFVEAAHAVGARHRRIIWKHILPNSFSPAVVLATRDVGRMVVVQSSLTFIGVGGSSAWATILNTGKDWIIGPGGNLFTRWWIYLPITLAVIFFGVSWSIMGDEINHWLNPRNA